MAKLTWEDRLLTMYSDDSLFPFTDFGKEAAKRADELDDEDLAEEIRDKGKEVDHALNELQDLMNDLDDLEKES